MGGRYIGLWVHQTQDGSWEARIQGRRVVGGKEDGLLWYRVVPLACERSADSREVLSYLGAALLALTERPAAETVTES